MRHTSNMRRRCRPMLTETRSRASRRSCAKRQPLMRETTTKCLGRRRRREKAAAAAVRSLAAPERAVRRGLRFGIWDSVRAEDEVGVSGRRDLLGRDQETVALATAPFTGGITVAHAHDPAGGGKDGIRSDQDQGSKDEREPCYASEHWQSLLVSVPARRSFKSTRSFSLASGLVSARVSCRREAYT